MTRNTSWGYDWIKSRRVPCWNVLGSVAVTTAGKQKLCCLIFRLPADKIVVQTTILRQLDDQAALYGSCLPA